MYHKTDGKIIEYAGDLDWFMSLYNSLQYSWNHYETADSLGFYPKDDATNFDEYIANNDESKSFNCKNKSLRDIDPMEQTES